MIPGIQQELPQELWEGAIDFLDARTRLILRLVWSWMKNYADDHLGWKHLFERKINITLFNDTEDRHWKKRYLLLEKTPFANMLIIQKAQDANLMGDDKTFNETVARQKHDSNIYVALFKIPSHHKIFLKMSKSPEFRRFNFFCIDTSNGLGTTCKGPIEPSTTIRIGGFFFHFHDRNFVIKAFNDAASLKEKSSDPAKESELIDTTVSLA